VIWRGTCYSFLSFLFLLRCSANNLIEYKGPNYPKPTIPSSSPPPLPASKRPTRPDMGGSSRAIASPFILHKMTISRPTLTTLMWGGARTSASILLPMAVGEFKA
jgi:hypothetical protein